MKEGTTTLLKVAVLIIGIAVLAMSAFWLPWLATDSAETNPEYAYLQVPVLVGVYVTLIPFILALYEAFKLLNLIESDNVFSELAVRSLGKIKKCAIAIIILYGVGMIFLAIVNALHPGIALIILVIIFATLVILLFASVLQAMLKRVLEIKEENDLTV